MTPIRVLAIDPGPSMSGFVVLDYCGIGGYALVAGNHVTNEVMAEGLYNNAVSLNALPLGLGAMAQRPTLAAVERMQYQGIRTGKYVLETARVGGIFMGLLIAAGYEPWESFANGWRKQLLGKATAKDAQIREYMEANVANWPTGRHNAKTMSHIADACGLAIIAARTHQAP